MKFFLLVEGKTEKEAAGEFLKRWLDPPPCAAGRNSGRAVRRLRTPGPQNVIESAGAPRRAETQAESSA